MEVQEFKELIGKAADIEGNLRLLDSQGEEFQAVSLQMKDELHKTKATIQNHWDTFGGLEGVNNLFVEISSRKLAVFRRGDLIEIHPLCEL